MFDIEGAGEGTTAGTVVGRHVCSVDCGLADGLRTMRFCDSKSPLELAC
jgi:hypothetical protein